MAANIKGIIDELETIANAFDSVDAFQFGLPSKVNEQPGKIYPLIHAESVLSGLTIERRLDLPKVKRYSIRVTFYDLFNLTEQQTVNIQSAYSALEIIADQYFAEVNNRNLKTNVDAGFFMNNFENLRGEYLPNAHNDKLIGIQYVVDFDADNLQCTKGTFNY